MYFLLLIVYLNYLDNYNIIYRKYLKAPNNCLKCIVYDEKDDLKG